MNCLPVYCVEGIALHLYFHIKLPSSTTSTSSEHLLKGYTNEFWIYCVSTPIKFSSALKIEGKLIIHTITTVEVDPERSAMQVYRSKEK